MTQRLETRQSTNPMIRGSRLLHTSIPRLQAAARPVHRVGALRGGFTGFLAGVVLTGAGAYYYLFDEYQAGQQAILADVIGLRESLQDLRSQINELKKDASGN